MEVQGPVGPLLRPSGPWITCPDCCVCVAWNKHTLETELDQARLWHCVFDLPSGHS